MVITDDRLFLMLHLAKLKVDDLGLVSKIYFGNRTGL